MSETNKAMSTSYKAVFIFSIFMCLFAFFASAITKSKGGGFGVWVWGYTAWLMYKHRNADLAIMYKFLLWFDGLAIAIIIFGILFPSSGFSPYMGQDLIYSLILLLVVLALMYGLFRFFKSQISENSNVSLAEDNEFIKIDDKHWEAALNETVNGDMISSIWAKSFAQAEGDDAKAKAMYIKARAESLSYLDSSSVETLVKTNSDKEGSSKSSFDVIEKVAVFGFILVVVAVVYAVVSDGSQSNAKSDVGQNYPTQSYPTAKVEDAPVINNTQSTNSQATANEPLYVSVYVSDAKGSGWAAGHSSLKEAESEARANCKKYAIDGKTCKKWFSKEAICVGVSRDSQGIYGGSWGDTEAQVTNLAVDNCKQHGGSDCTISGTLCGVAKPKNKLSNAPVTEHVTSTNETSALTLSMIRGSSWRDNVAKLRGALASNSINSYPAIPERIFNLNEVYNKPWAVWNEKLSDFQVTSIEDKNIWWIENGKFFIRLFNPSNKNMKGFVVSLSSSFCGDLNAVKALFFMELTPTLLAPNQYAIFVSELPKIQDFTKSTCAIVESAYVSKR